MASQCHCSDDGRWRGRCADLTPQRATGAGHLESGQHRPAIVRSTAPISRWRPSLRTTLACCEVTLVNSAYRSCSCSVAGLFARAPVIRRQWGVPDRQHSQDTMAHWDGRAHLIREQANPIIGLQVAPSRCVRKHSHGMAWCGRQSGKNLFASRSSGHGTAVHPTL